MPPFVYIDKGGDDLRKYVSLFTLSMFLLPGVPGAQTSNNMTSSPVVVKAEKPHKEQILPGKNNSDLRPGEGMTPLPRNEAKPVKPRAGLTPLPSNKFNPIKPGAGLLPLPGKEQKENQKLK